MVTTRIIPVMRWGVLAAGTAMLCVCAAPALAESSAPDAGRAFAVQAPPAALYGVQAPATDRALQDHDVIASDGAKIHVQVWLPVAKAGHVPPARVPVVAVLSPYNLEDVPRPDRFTTDAWVNFFVSRGFAVATVHLRGTGQSDGCWDPHVPQQADDSSRAIEWLGGASFSDGNVGTFGKSHDGGAQLNMAGRGDQSRLGALRTIGVWSPVTSYEDFNAFDGVPLDEGGSVITQVDADTSYTGRTVTEESTDLVDNPTSERYDPQAVMSRAPCLAAEAADGASHSGVMTAWRAERELTSGVANIRVPTFYSYGTYETQSKQVVGAFDRVGADAPGGPPQKVGLFGNWLHDYPSENSLHPGWSRKDFEGMVYAWYSHWLRGTNPEVASWPVAQVQGTDGQWRAEQGFPRTGGPEGQLALGGSGVLGTTAPSGSDSYRQPAGSLSWSTGTLPGRLEVTGQPVLDLWVQTDQTSGYLSAELLAYDATGTEIPYSRRIGGRSLRTLEPLVHDRFVQTTEHDPPLNTPIHLQLRFEPADTVVPRGGHLEVHLGDGLTAWRADQHWALAPNTDDSFVDDPVPATITVLHDCAHPSALRFLRPRSDADLLDVQETDQLASNLGKSDPVPSPVASDGGGLATASIC